MLDAKSLMEGLETFFALQMLFNWLDDQNVREVLRIVIFCLISLKLFEILFNILTGRRFTLREVPQGLLGDVLGHFTAN